MNVPGTDWRFQDPAFLLLFVVLVLLPILLRRRRRRTGTLRFSDTARLRAMGASWRVRLRPVLRVLRVLALSLFILAMARPQKGWSERQIRSYGVDIMLAVDISASMRETDFRPNRLEASKKVIGDFLDHREFDRIGVVIFGNEALTLCPMTLDYSAIKDFISRLDFRRLGEQNTALGRGLATAVKRLEDSDAKSRIIILLTDGMDTVEGEQAPLEAAKLAQALGIRVYTIGVGSDQPQMINWGGMTLPLGMGGGHFNEQGLQEIASTTGGQYYHATDEKRLEEIYAEIDSLEKSKADYTEFDYFDERMALAAGPALLLLLLEILLGSSWLSKAP